MYIGCHLSISEGFYKMGEKALSIGADTFQFFTRNPRGGAAREPDRKDLDMLAYLMEENRFGPILAHAPYTMNLCSNDEKTREFANMILADDLKRLEDSPCHNFVFHPGSHVGQGVEKGIDYITEALNRVMSSEMKTTVLLETMSGKGSEIGSSFEELAKIISGLDHPEKAGICLDTCHMLAAGYDIVNDLQGVLDEFDEKICLEKVKFVHLNDSLEPLGSRKDRHAGIGEGYIGLEPTISILTHPFLKRMPFILETPYDSDGHEKEIRMIREILLIRD